MAGLIHLGTPPQDGPPPLALSPDFREFTGAPSLSELLHLAREVVADPSFPTVRAWAEGGRRAVGCFPVYTPQELIHSMGLLPVSMHGAGENLEISHADAALGSFLCSISKSTLELAQTDRLGVFGAFVFPYICDVSRNLEGIFDRRLPGVETHMLHLPQNFHSSGTVPFLVAEYGRLIAKLEKIGGLPYRPSALAGSMRLFAEHRARVAELARIKRTQPGKLSLTESYLLRRLGGLLPREVHVAILDRALAEIAERPSRRKDAVRVLTVGSFCEQPTLDLIDLLEQVGCDVVADDFLPAQTWYGPVEPDGDPLGALVRAYTTSPVDIGIRLTPTTKEEAILRKVEESRAQAVVFLTAKFCEPALEDVVLYRRALDRRGIPYLHLEFEERSAAYEQSRLQLETFVESILFN